MAKAMKVLVLRKAISDPDIDLKPESSPYSSRIAQYSSPNIAFGEPEKMNEDNPAGLYWTNPNISVFLPEVSRRKEFDFVGEEGDKEWTEDLARIISHEVGHQLTLDEKGLGDLDSYDDVYGGAGIPDWLSMLQGFDPYTARRRTPSGQAEKDRMASISNAISSTNTVETPSYHMEFPESSYLANKLRIERQVVPQVMPSVRRSMNFNFGDTRKLMNEALPKGVADQRRAYQLVDDFGGSDSTPAEKERAFRRIKGVMARQGSNIVNRPLKQIQQAIRREEAHDSKLRTAREKGFDIPSLLSGKTSRGAGHLGRRSGYKMTGEPMQIAWQLLKELSDADGPLRRFYNPAQGEENLQIREAAHVSALTPKIDQTPVPETPMVDMPDGFFGNHAHERLTDQDRVMDEQEEEEVRSRITEAMQPFVDERGNFKLGAPKQIAIRTHLLDEHRQPDEAMSLSNGNSIVGIVRPHMDNKLKPDLHTVMLRRSELSNKPQPFTTDALRVDRVVNNHGVSKKRFKSMVRAHRRTLHRAEPMDITFRLLKAYEDEHLQSYLDGDTNEMSMFGNSFDQKRYPFLHYNANAIVNDNEVNEGAVNELMATGEGIEAFEPSLRQYENDLKLLHDNEVLRRSPQGSPPQLSNSADRLLRGYREDYGWHDMTHEHAMHISMGMYFAMLKAMKLKHAETSFDPSTLEDLKSEPMDIAFRLLKERKSPEAWANKKRYDSEYQKTPKRVKYREQLNAERRKRGIYGKGGKDVSHTQGGKLTLESAHANRARHFKNKGTLRRVK